MGKRSLINLLLGQDFAIVSDQAGTTTDPVKKRMEIPDIGPVQLIDTAGFDDDGEVGLKRVEKTMKVVEEIDMALLLFTGNHFGKPEKDLLARLKEFEVPVVVVHNQSDVVPLDCGVAGDLNNMYDCDVVEFSCRMQDPQEQREAVDMLMAFIVKGLLLSGGERTIMEGLVEPGDKFVLVCPIDSEAPAGRLILPQVMAIRDILDNGGIAPVLQPQQLSHEPQIVFNDSVENSFAQWATGNPGDEQVISTVNTAQAALDLVAAGVGICILPETCIQQRQDIRFLPLTGWHQALYMCILYDRWLEPPIWGFVEKLVKTIRKLEQDAHS